MTTEDEYIEQFTDTVPGIRMCPGSFVENHCETECGPCD